MKLADLHLILRGKKRGRVSKWSSGGGGLSKHYHSGSSKHKKNAIIRCREYNRQTEMESIKMQSKKPQMFSSIKELFN